MRANPETVSHYPRPTDWSPVAARPGQPRSRGEIAAIKGESRRKTSRWRTFAATRTRTQGPPHDASKYTTGNSPQTNHIKNITSLFPCTGTTSSVRGSCNTAPRAGAVLDPPGALVRGTPKRVVDFTPGEIEAAPARQVLRTRVVEMGHA
jgi:hypothetical protein